MVSAEISYPSILSPKRKDSEAAPSRCKWVRFACGSATLYFGGRDILFAIEGGKFEWSDIGLRDC